MNIRRSVAATAVVLSALALAACSSDGDEKTAADPVAALKESGVLKVGTEGTYAPFTFHDPTSGELTGYDVEVITAVAEKLGVKPEFSETKWDSIFAGLEAKRYDVVANEVTINAWSVAVPRRTAAMRPIVRPIASSHRIAPTMRRRLAGRRAAISSLTSERWM